MDPGLEIYKMIITSKLAEESYHLCPWIAVHPTASLLRIITKDNAKDDAVWLQGYREPAVRSWGPGKEWWGVRCPLEGGCQPLSSNSLFPTQLLHGMKAKAQLQPSNFMKNRN